MNLHSIVEKPTGTLRPSKRNARTHSKKQVEQIVNSIRRFGWTYPIIIDELGNILCGVGRWLAAQRLGLAKVPVISLSHLSDTQKRALIIADNKIPANAGWDRPRLAAELGELAILLPEIDLDISITGFEAPEIDSLALDLTDAEKEPSDEIPPVENGAPITQTGDLWELGNHRLLCRDCCDATSISQLMGGHRASMVFADPPYNIRISAAVNRGRIKHREFLIASGEMSPSQFIDFLQRWMTAALKHTVEGAIIFSCMDWKHSGELLAAGASICLELKNIVVWVKSNAGQGSFYRSQHEFIFVYKNGSAPHQNNIELGKHGRHRSNVWSYPGVNSFRAGRLDELALHPTVKPTALVADAMRDCSSRGEIVLDPFIGSGTTILAAERVGRRAYGLELDPVYVDVAIRRWQGFTGRDAILESTGQTFDEVTAQGRSKRV